VVQILRHRDPRGPSAPLAGPRIVLPEGSVGRSERRSSASRLTRPGCPS